MPPKKEKSDLPSWVRLLRDSEFGEPETVYSGRKNGESIVGLVDKPRYNASGGKKYEQPPGNDQVHNTPIQDFPPRKKQMSTDVPDFIIPSIIWAKGFKLARVKKVSSIITSGLITRSSLRDIGWTGVNNGQHISPDHVWRTLIADRDSKGQVPPTWYRRMCLRCLELADAFNGDLNIDRLLQGSEMSLSTEDSSGPWIFHRSNRAQKRGQLPKVVPILKKSIRRLMMVFPACAHRAPSKEISFVSYMGAAYLWS